MLLLFSKIANRYTNTTKNTNQLKTMKWSSDFTQILILFWYTDLHIVQIAKRDRYKCIIEKSFKSQANYARMVNFKRSRNNN